MKTKPILLSICLLLTGTSFAQPGVWGENNTRTDTRDWAGDYGLGVMSGFYQSPTPNPYSYPSVASSWWHLLDVRHSNPDNNYAMQFSGSFFDQKLYFRKTNNWAYRPWSKVVLENPSGQVGINTDNPQYILDVNGPTRATSLFSPSLAMFEYDGFSYNGNYLDNNGIKWAYDSWSNGGPTGCFSGFRGVKFFTASQPRMSITASGNVGIGTTSPPEMLSVEGTIAGRRVKVTQVAWPDYVFEKDYPLKALDSVETFVSIYKHLPEIKPAAQVISDGLDLGENQAALLKKVEELTLYIIELNKTVKQLSADNVAQKEQLKKLQARISN